jgi:UDP-N-acetylmuramoyl-tripeptide--D-alanyl-D-alanine ligase
MNIAQLYELFLHHPSIQTDTRKLRPGDLFFALKGPNFNGNRFAAAALQQGAAYAIIDEPPAPGPPPPAPEPSPASPTLPPRMILVDDALATLQALAKHHRQQFDIPFIAITGSNGKTTTKELIHAVLSSTYTVYTTEGNLNNHIGVPLTLLSVKKDAQFAIIEMGANHRGEISSYCAYTLPTHGIITNAGKAHLEGFGGPEGVKKGKGELYDFLRTGPSTAMHAEPPATDSATTGGPGGTAFVMWDYDYLREMSRGIPHIVTYGTSNADLTGVSEQSGHFLSVRITHGATTGLIPTQLVGDYNLPNVLVAVAIGKYFGVPDDRIRSAIAGYAPSNSRSQLIEKDGNHIILDAYNANPSSMKAAIENFARIKGGSESGGIQSGAAESGGVQSGASENRKVLILGAMAELGPGSIDEHRQVIELIGQYPWQQVVLVGGDFLKTTHPFLSFDNSREAGQWLKNANLKDAYILIKGSRSMRMEDVLT